MRVAILLYPNGSPEKLRALSKGLVDGFQSKGHSADVFDLRSDDNIRVGMFDYVCVGTNGSGLFSGKIDARLKGKLEAVGGLSGKRCFAFVQKKRLFTERLLNNLMNAMEAQGMFMRNSGIFAQVEDARLTGTGLNLERNTSSI